MHLEQNLRQLVKTEGDYKSEIYRGIKYEIQRHPFGLYLCGYLFYTPRNQHERELIDTDFHCGITYEKNGKVGFDCSHAMDLNLLQVINEGLLGAESTRFYKRTYRTMEYVEGILKKTIDNIIDGKNKEPEAIYEWDFDKLNAIKEEQDEVAEQKIIEDMAKTIRKGNFTVISDERLKELHVQEKALEILLNGTISLWEDVQGVIPND